MKGRNMKKRERERERQLNIYNLAKAVAQTARAI